MSSTATAAPPAVPAPTLYGTSPVGNNASTSAIVTITSTNAPLAPGPPAHRTVPAAPRRPDPAPVPPANNCRRIVLCPAATAGFTSNVPLPVAVTNVVNADPAGAPPPGTLGPP